MGDRRLGSLLVRAVLLGIGIGVAVFVACWALAWLSTTVPQARTAEAVRVAFAARDLRPDGVWRLGDTDIGAHQFNDCLVIGQALDVRAPARMLAVSPLTGLHAPGGACAHLERLASATPPAPGEVYHNYVHAGTTLARVLLPSFGVRGLREAYRLISSLILLAGIAYALLGLARRRRPGIDAAWLVIFVAVARWFGLETFGQSVAHAPADIVALALLLWLSRGSAIRPMSRRTAIVGAAVFGGLTMAFELLTGGLPLGLAITLGALPLALPADERAAGTTLSAGIAFAVAAISCLLAKVVAVALAWGPAPIAAAARELAFLTPARPTDLAGDSRAGVLDYLTHVWAGLDSLAPGLLWLTTGALLLAVVAGVWSVRRVRRDAASPDRLRVTCLVGSNLILAAWLLLLWQHTAIHAWFMDRILVWTIASGGAAFVLALGSRGDAVVATGGVA